jgi:hypothetical protein
VIAEFVLMYRFTGFFIRLAGPIPGVGRNLEKPDEEHEACLTPAPCCPLITCPFALLGLAFWVSADAATDLTDAGVRGLLNSLAAVDATRAEVCSFVGFLEDMGFSLSVRGKWERRESGPADSRRGWIRQTIASDPDVSASAGTQPPGVRTGTGCMRARRRFSIGGRPWPTPHES